MTEESTEVSLARIETKLDAALKNYEDHEERIRVMEKLIWRASGGFAVASAITGGVLGFAASFVLLGGQ